MKTQRRDKLTAERKTTPEHVVNGATATHLALAHSAETPHGDSPPHGPTQPTVGQPKTIHCEASGETHTCASGTRDCYNNSPQYCGSAHAVGTPKTIHCTGSAETHECAAGTRYCYNDSPLFCDSRRPVGHGTKTITCLDGSSRTCHVGTEGCYDGSTALCPRSHHLHHRPHRPPWLPSTWSWWYPSLVSDPMDYVPLPVYQQLPDASLLNAVPNLDCIAQYCGQLQEQDALGCWCGALQSAAQDLNKVGVPVRAPACTLAADSDLVLGTVVKELCVIRS